MKKFEGILITTDLDGTLLRNDKSVSRENLSAIEYFKENAGVFTFVTGRPSVIVGDIYSLVRPNAPIGCFNGGGICDMETGEYLSKHPLSREALELVRFVDESIPDMSIQLCGFDKSYFCKMNDAMEEHRITANFPDLRCHYTEFEGELAKVLFAHFEEKELFRLRDLLLSHPLSERFQLMRSAEEYLEILPKGVDKGKNLTDIADSVGIDIKRSIAIGDNDNDASMLEKAGIGIAVGNASEIAKSKADIITVSNEESAIARVIKDIDEGKIKV